MGCMQSHGEEAHLDLELGDMEDGIALQRLRRWLRPLLLRKHGLNLRAWRLAMQDEEERDDLRLDRARLRRVPREIGRLHALQRLELQDNRLQSIPREVGQLMALTALDLSDNQLCSIPREIGQLFVLRNLNLDRNQLSAIPAELGCLGSLCELRLQDNLLRSLPSELGFCAALKELNLTHNRLQALPASLGKLAMLNMLRLGHNELEAVPSELNCLEKLLVLEIHANSLAGPFNLLPLFQRLSGDAVAKLSLWGNAFEPVDIGDAKFTGTLHDPITFGVCSSVCTASFCGTEFLSWQWLLARTSLQRKPYWSQLCVFLPDYASARKREKAPSDCHAGGLGSKECEALGAFFERADRYTAGRASRAHRKFGCCWFRKWVCNIEAALERGHRRFVVFTKTDRTVGACQAVEWAYLQEKKRTVRDLKVHCVSAAESMNVLKVGPYRGSFEGHGAFVPFSRPLWPDLRPP